MPKKKESKKRAAPPSLQELLDRPWCYYCERDFDDVKVLLSHQKAKHFKCNSCFTRTLSTPGGLRVHMAQVHKITMTEIENALPGRGDPNTEIFAMIGIPDAIMEAHKQRVAQSYYDAEAAHRKETGNPPPGTKTGADGNKKRKMETPEELKQRLAEHKAKKAAEKAAAQAGVGNDSATPVDAGDHAEVFYSKARYFPLMHTLILTRRRHPCTLCMSASSNQASARPALAPLRPTITRFRQMELACRRHTATRASLPVL